MRRAEILALVAGLLLCAGLLPLGLARMSTEDARHAQDALRTVWSIAFLAAGTLHLVRWRVTGESRTGLRGAASVSLGALSAPTATIAPMLASSVTTAALSPLSRTLAVVACLSLLTRAAHAPAVDTGVRPLRALAVTVIGGWLFLAVMVLLAANHRPADAGPTAWFGLEAAMTLGWLLCATAAGWRARLDRNVTFLWLAIGSSLMGTAEMCRGLAFAVDPRWQFLSTGLQLVAAAVVLINAATDLTMLLSAESRLLHVMSGTVREAEAQLTADDRAEASRRHDARAVLAALRAASLVLDRYDETLDHDTRTQLLGSFTTELQRLEQMIERRSDAALETFALDDVLRPALGTLADASVAMDLAPTLVRGRAHELTGLVQTVVSMLARRSGDGRVHVRVARSTSGVQVICEAAGRPDASGTAAARPGDDESARNLRLQVARRVMREQGGDVVVNERWDGSMSVALWLRPAPADAVVTAGPPLLDDNDELNAVVRQQPAAGARRRSARVIGQAS